MGVIEVIVGATGARDRREARATVCGARSLKMMMIGFSAP